MNQNTPTPAELAAFLNAMGRRMPEGEEAFLDAIETWNKWQTAIAVAAKYCAERQASIEADLVRVPYAQALHDLGTNHEKTVRKWWREIFPAARVEGGWSDRKTNGFPKIEFDQLENERNRLAKLKASAGGKAKAKKAVKKSMQGNDRPFPR